MKENLKDHYVKKLEANKLAEKKLSNKIRLIGWTRLFVFIVICISGYYTFTIYGIIITGLFAISILAFFFLIRMHQLLINKREIISNLIIINKNEIDILSHQPSIFDNGINYFDNSSYCEDLDVFGDASLFHHINRTTTIPGKEQLANILKAPLTLKEDILKQQEAVKEFALKEELRQNLIAHGMRSQKEQPDVQNLIHWAAGKENFSSVNTIKVIRILFPLLFLATLILFILSANASLVVIAFFVNLFISGLFLKKVNHIHNTLSSHIKSFSVFSAMLRLITKENFSSTILKESAFKTSEASHQLKKISVIGNFFDQRINFILAIMFNGIFLYDLQCLSMLEKWKKKNGQKLSMWIGEIGNIEMLNSMANFAFNNPGYIYPEFVEGKPYLKAEEMGHPLIDKERCISNDIELGADKKLFIITGSNMSGKSTFLRTVGINLLMARCGMPVFARLFKCCPMEICTSLRLSDSLNDNVSLFYAELKKLKSILERLKPEVNAIVLLDEILKGTNSDDKHHGCRQLVKKLIGRNCITIMATHDIELTGLAMEHPAEIENYCFESNLSDDELTFDYKLKMGISKNRNATFLMKKMGIID